MDRLKSEWELQKKLYNRAQSEIQFLRSQDNKLKFKLINFF